MLGTLVVSVAVAERAAAQVVPDRPTAAPAGAFRLPDPFQSLDEVYPGLRITSDSRAPAAEFRPRPKASWLQPHADSPETAARSLETTTAWQRLRDYRSRIGIRVLTLWETPGSTVSLQAGKHGGPSLQWSSRVMGRGDEASRGLLDHLVSATTGGMRRAASAGPIDHGTHPTPHLAEGHLDTR